jgi:hypothetical protein
LYLRSIAEAYSKIITFQTEEISDIKYKEERLKLLEDLFDMLKDEQNPDINENITSIIISVFNELNL